MRWASPIFIDRAALQRRRPRRGQLEERAEQDLRVEQQFFRPRIAGHTFHPFLATRQGPQRMRPALPGRFFFS